MKRNLTKAVAIGAAIAATVAGSATVASSASAEHGERNAAAKNGITKFGYYANVFGTKVAVNGIDIKTAKDALARQQCTRVLRGETVKPSTISTNIVPDSVPYAELIHVSPSTSRTKTFRTVNGEYGVLGINTIGDIELGGELEGVPTPTLKIEALQSYASSWNDTKANNGNGKFKALAEFGFGDISLQLNGPAETQELQNLLDIIQQSIPIKQVVTQLVDLLEQVGVIEIPGLGSIALGQSTTRVTAHSAQANAYALMLTVQPEGTGKTVLQLGRAFSRVTDGVKSGVFRSQMSALSANVADLVTVGGVSTQTLPCEGTNGQVRTKSVPLAEIPGVISLNGVKYSWMGKQKAKGKSKAFMQTQIGSVSIPSGDVLITGLTSRLDLRSPGVDEKVKRTATAKVGKITVGGTTIPTPKPGQTVNFEGGSLVFRKVEHNNYNGADVFGLVITLFEQNLVIHLGEASGRIFYR